MIDTFLFSYRKSSARRCSRIRRSPKPFVMRCKVVRNHGETSTPRTILVLDHGFDIEHALDLVYQQLDLFLSYKRRYKSFKYITFTRFIWIPMRVFAVHSSFMVTMSSRIIVSLSWNKCLICTNDVWAVPLRCHPRLCHLVWRVRRILRIMSNKNFNNN